MKYHNDTIAINYSFYEMLTLKTSNETIMRDVEKLKNRCLDPGVYVKHLKNWLKFFSPKQIYALDGDQLRYEPVKCLNNLQKFLPVQNIFNFKSVIRFDRKKKFFCAFFKEKQPFRIKCLGSSKGRKYPKLDISSRAILEKFYNKTNKSFLKLLKKYSYQIPNWLINE